ncbi:GNAT family N-acetyltransferase [Rubrobacter tropicus]|uniref:GNAT family N-acetyltransferase n=1 Tax=Rubrobacter tropicus TaxID=2653851 RepID=A0A6G8QEL3_9ACTN|nr:GNAT family N-acetyltransferase [Rubrobacter tropicus]QIN84930.1 GNAT family N-acetyltransferase [Rubrobacter tropicus]
MQPFTTKEDLEVDATYDRNGLLNKTGPGVRIRQMDDADLERILELRSVVRWSADPRAFDLLRGVRDARWFVAESPGGSLVGMVGAVPLGSIGVLCHLAVHDGHRRLGLGADLSSWAVAYLKSRGARTVRLYATRQAEGLYRSLGFRASAARTIYRLDGPRGRPRAFEEAGGNRVETLAFADLPELYGVDRWSYGADRSPLIFATLRLHPGEGLVARDSSGGIKGYLIRSAGTDAMRLGPFVAAGPDVARLLLARALRETGPAPVRVIVPGPATSPAHALLREFGFEGRKDRLRMELGGPLDRPDGLEHYGTTPYMAT